MTQPGIPVTANDDQIKQLDFPSRHDANQSVDLLIQRYPCCKDFVSSDLIGRSLITDLQESLKTFDAIAKKMADLIGVRQISELSESSMNSDADPAKNENATYLYMAYREKIAQIADMGWISDEDLMGYYNKRIQKITDSLSKYQNTSYKRAISGFYQSSQLIRAAIKNSSEKQRADFRDSIKRESKVLLSATRGNININYKIARGELRGFLKSLDISAPIAKEIHGGLLETVVAGSERFQSKLNLSHSSIYITSYCFMSAAISAMRLQAGTLSMHVPLVSAGAITVGSIVHLIKEAKNRRSISAQRLVPNRPSATLLFDSYHKIASKLPTVEVVDTDGAIIGTGFDVNGFPEGHVSKEIDDIGERVSSFDGVVPDPSTVDPQIPPSICISTVHVDSFLGKQILSN